MPPHSRFTSLYSFHTLQELAHVDGWVVPAAEARLLQSVGCESESLPLSAVVQLPLAVGGFGGRKKGHEQHKFGMIPLDI